MSKQYQQDNLARAEARLIFQRSLLSDQMRKVLEIEDLILSIKTEIRKIESEESFAEFAKLIDNSKPVA